MTDRISCRLPGCQCTHTDGCVAGFLDDDEYGATPCPTCRPDLARIVAVSWTREQLVDRWHARNAALRAGATRDAAATSAIGSVYAPPPARNDAPADTWTQTAVS